MRGHSIDDRRALAVGDTVVVVGVLLAGVLHHGRSPLAEPVGVAGTILPFLAGWWCCALLVGLYAEHRRAASVRSVRLLSVSWLGATAVGLVARSSPALAGDVTWPFGLVVVATVLAGLVAWRAGATGLDRLLAAEQPDAE